MASVTATQEQVRAAGKAEVTVATGVAGAAVLAGGIGTLLVGLMTTASELSESLANSLNFVRPVGPLSGKTTVAVIVWLVSWIGLHAALKNKDVDLTKIFVASLALIFLGITFTFPPFFELLAGG